MTLFVLHIPDTNGERKAAKIQVAIIVAHVASDLMPHEVAKAFWGFDKAISKVFPAHYGDSMTHFFTSWTSKGFRDGCYDLQCTGFQPGFQPGNITYFPGIELESSNISLKVSKDIKTGDWWVYLNNIPLGYYPKGLFTTLGNSGTVVSIGGSVSFTKGQMSPPMGSGNFSDNGKETAQIRKIKLINATGGEQYPSPTDFTPVPDDHKCFKISPITDSESHDGYYFNYGGPAGCTS